MTERWQWVGWISIVLGIASAVAVAIDVSTRHRQHMAIMNLVWPLTALYAGPLGLAAYFGFGRGPSIPPGNVGAQAGPEHQEKRPMWQAALLGATHCGAGCMLGDVLVDAVLYLVGATALLGSFLLTSYVFEFVAAFVFGIAFQYFAIVPMRKLSPGRGLVAALKADTLSLVSFQVGMYAWMALVQTVFFRRPLEASSPVFWFMMQIGMLAGLGTSFPMNFWLVKRGIKERM